MTDEDKPIIGAELQARARILIQSIEAAIEDADAAARQLAGTVEAVRSLGAKLAAVNRALVELGKPAITWSSGTSLVRALLSIGLDRLVEQHPHPRDRERQP